MISIKPLQKSIPGLHPRCPKLYTKKEFIGPSLLEETADKDHYLNSSASVILSIILSTGFTAFMILHDRAFYKLLP
jgi:hypothetical protein